MTFSRSFSKLAAGMCCAAVLAFGASLVLMTSGTSLDLRTVPLP